VKNLYSGALLMGKKIPKDQPVQVLSIGTRILIKDVMDQFLRSLGEVKTYYAVKMSTAVDSFKERRHNIIFCEQSFPEGGALEFIEAIGGLHPTGRHYFVLAAESSSDELVSLAMEKGIDEILVKPFSTDNIAQIVDRFLEKRSMIEIDWVKDLSAARVAFDEKRFNEADQLFGEVAKKHWENSAVLLDSAEFFLERNQPQKTLTLLEKVLSGSPESVRALHLMGCALKKTGRFREAIERFNKASRLSPLNSIRYCELADAHVQLADELVQTAIKFESESSALILRRANYLLLKKDYGALVAYLETKKSYISESGRKEAESLVGVAKKLGGLK
jgi:DNA-binding NarL/FixJ family response regulator